MSTTPTERRLQGEIAALTRWSHTVNRSAATLPARQAFHDKFEKQVDPEGNMSPADRAKAAQNARTLHYKKMAQKSVQARRRRAAMERKGSTRPGGAR